MQRVSEFTILQLLPLLLRRQEREQELAAREDQLEAWKAQFKAEAVRQVGAGCGSHRGLHLDGSLVR